MPVRDSPAGPGAILVSLGRSPNTGACVKSAWRSPALPKQAGKGWNSYTGATMVKRAYDLYPRVYAFDNLVWEERTAARGKRGRPDIAAFEYHLEDHLLELQAALRDKTYAPGPYRRYTVREPKERVISAAPYRDRVVHQRLFENSWGRCWMRHFERIPVHTTADFRCVGSSFVRSSATSQSFQTVSELDFVHFSEEEHGMRLLGAKIAVANPLSCSGERSCRVLLPL